MSLSLSCALLSALFHHPTPPPQNETMKMPTREEKREKRRGGGVCIISGIKAREGWLFALWRQGAEWSLMTVLLFALVLLLLLLPNVNF